MKCTCGFTKKGKFKAGTTEFTCPNCNKVHAVKSDPIKEPKDVVYDDDGKVVEEEPVERGICINDEKGFKVNIGKESSGGYWLKIESKPTMYPANYKMMLKWIKETKAHLKVQAELSEKAVVSIEKLIEIEDGVDQIILKCAEEIKAKIEQIEIKK